MARKSERHKSKKSPDKSPRRAGRPSKRRKKSDSESSEDHNKEKKESESTHDVETTSQHSEASGEGGVLSERAKRSSRRNQGSSTPSASTPGTTVPAAAAAVAPASAPAPAPAPEDWVEDKKFWGAEGEAKVEETPGEGAGTEEGCEWKVQTSNGKGGVIQKLRICRTRLPGSESASELSPSPGKESPIPKGKRGKDGSEGEGTESGESADQPRLRLKLKTVKSHSTPEPDQVISSESGETSCEAKDKAATEETEGNLATGHVIVEQVADISTSEGVEHEEVTKVEEMRDAELAAAVSSIIGVDPSFHVRRLSNEEFEENKIATGNKNVDAADKESSKVKSVSADGGPAEIEKQHESDKPKTCDTLKKDSSKAEEDSSKINKPNDNVPKIEESSKSKLEDIKEPMETDDMDTESRRSSEDAGDDGVEINISPEEIEAATGGLDETTPLRSRHGVPRSEPVPSKKTQETRRGSSAEDSGSRKKEGDKESKVSLRQSLSKEEEVAKKLSSESDKKQTDEDQKEEGELDADHDELTSKRTVRTNRSLSTTSTTSQDSLNSKTAATTAKKHPLITGPEPDTEVKLRRQRKISVLSPASASRTSHGGRQVRSIAGDALKSILPTVSAEIEKKECEKQAARDKILKVRSEKQQQAANKVEVVKPVMKSSKSTSKLKEVDEKMVVRVVDDVREVVNRLKDEKKEEKKSKSNSENLEPKPSKVVRKVTVASVEEDREVKAVKPTRAASPGDSAATPVLFVTNLVRPFTAHQLRDLLARTGTIAQDGFFIDKIKSKCYVKFTDVEMAIETRHALDGVRWPASNPKTLRVRYVTEGEMAMAISDADREQQWISGHALANDNVSRVSVGGVREWDVGKIGGHEEDVPVDKWRLEGREPRRDSGTRIDEPGERTRREETSREEPQRQDMRQDFYQRKRPFSPEKPTHAEPARKFKRKDHDGPAKLLDDLFRKTKATPSLYWLPLSSAQIAVKEEMRRKHMAEHKRRIAELEKSDLARREKVRERRRK